MSDEKAVQFPVPWARGGERTNLVERLEWWLAYYNDDVAGRGPHPDYIEAPEGFDETAIESDLREAVRRLREIDGERRIKGWIEPTDFNEETAINDGIVLWKIDRYNATLILHTPQEQSE